MVLALLGDNYRQLYICLFQLVQRPLVAILPNADNLKKWGLGHNNALQACGVTCAENHIFSTKVERLFV